jgi:hypothetical protein
MILPLEHPSSNATALPMSRLLYCMPLFTREEITGERTLQNLQLYQQRLLAYPAGQAYNGFLFELETRAGIKEYVHAHFFDMVR